MTSQLVSFQFVSWEIVLANCTRKLWSVTWYFNYQVIKSCWMHHPEARPGWPQLITSLLALYNDTLPGEYYDHHYNYNDNYYYYNNLHYRRVSGTQ